jgi:hypothetical protein
MKFGTPIVTRQWFSLLPRKDCIVLQPKPKPLDVDFSLIYLTNNGMTGIGRSITGYEQAYNFIIF